MPIVQAALYQLALERKVGEYEFPEGASLIACGEALQGKFSIRYRITPVQDAEQFMAKLATDDMDRVKRDIESQI